MGVSLASLVQQGSYWYLPGFIDAEEVVLILHGMPLAYLASLVQQGSYTYCWLIWCSRAHIGVSLAYWCSRAHIGVSLAYWCSRAHIAGLFNHRYVCLIA